jgi:hypothetical protein
MTILAWHFLAANGRMAHTGTPVVAGETYRYEEKLVLCHDGLHASEKAIDALYYSPGPVVCRVECGGDIVQGDDKLVCSERRVLWMADATRELRLFGCWCARRAMALIPESKRDPRSMRAIEASESYACGKATKEELDAARDAAWYAARDAARDAAMYAARDAAWYAAWDAARDAEREIQNAELTRRLEALAPAE